MTPQLTREVLEQALGLLERDGWAQNTYGPLDPKTRGPRCMIGAVIAGCRAVSGWPNVEESIDALGELSGVGEKVSLWNDTRGRTKDEVLAAVRKAIDAVR